MVTIEEFRKELIGEVKNEAASFENYEVLQFLETVTARLSEYEVCYPATGCYFERVGKGRKRLLVHGYYDLETDIDNALYLYVCDYSFSDVPVQINNSKFNDLVKRCIAFIEDSRSGYIEDNVEVSDPGYALAQNIRKRFDDYSRIYIYVVTDKVRSGKFHRIDDHSACGKQTFLTLIDISYFYEVCSSHLEASDIVISVNEHNCLGIPCIAAGNTDDGICESYIGAIPGRFLAEIYDKYGSHLLESNVRSFLTVKTKVNSGIRRTIQTDPRMFFAYNNGVAITATSIEYDDVSKYITSFTNLQIVNGGQTTVSLFRELKTKFKDNLDLIFVPFKLTVINSDDSSEIVRNISKFANTQNAVKDSDLDSNTEFQKNMERLSRTILIPQSKELGSRRWYYERVRGQYEQEKSKLSDPNQKKFAIEFANERRIDKINFAKYRYMLELRPDYVSQGGQTCYSYYSKEVADSWSANKEQYNELYFKETVSIAILYKAIYKAVHKCDWFTGSFRAQITYYAIPKLFTMLENKGYALDLQRIWKDQNVDETVISQILTIAEVFLNCLKEKGNAGSNPTQWCKKSDCWDYFKNLKVDFDNDVLKYCISLEDYEEINLAAVNNQKILDKDQAILDVEQISASAWIKFKMVSIRNNMESNDLAILDEVIKHQKDPLNELKPSSALRALELYDNKD